MQQSTPTKSSGKKNKQKYTFQLITTLRVIKSLIHQKTEDKTNWNITLKLALYQRVKNSAFGAFFTA